jgi:hypothetical protein
MSDTGFIQQRSATTFPGTRLVAMDVSKKDIPACHALTLTFQEPPLSLHVSYRRLVGPRLVLSLHACILFTRYFSAIGRQQINCSAVEFVTITPPSGQTCGQYMDRYISSSGGYLTNPNATSSCQFCGVRTTDELMGASFNIFYHHHWRNFGLMIAFIVFNVRSFPVSRSPPADPAIIQVFCVFALTYLFRIRTGSLLPSFRRSKKT